MPRVISKALKAHFPSADVGREMHDLAKRLFPICRSLTGDGFRQTLKILQKTIPLKIFEVPSGTKVFDWTVPDEWNIRDAYVKDSSGRRVIDFKKSNLHVVGYSVPFSGKMSLAELKPHLHTLPSQPDVIPYVTSYYSRRWGFALPHNELLQLREDTYEVRVDSTLKPGSLTYGEFVIPGKSKDEIFLSTYCCHPSMANNELSGPLVTSYVAKAILARGKKPELTFRFVFIPETIGAITYLSRNLKKLKKNVKAGWVVTCCGDEGPYSYMPSRDGEALVDRVTLHMLKHCGKPTKIYDFLERESDERQYCAPGVDLPMGSLMRSKYHSYPQYHTSADNLDFVTPAGLAGTLDMYLRCIDALETNARYICTTLGEPQLGKRGLYPNLSTKESLGAAVADMMNLLAYADGKRDLLAVADRLGRPVSILVPIARKLEQAGLLRRARG